MQPKHSTVCRHLGLDYCSGLQRIVVEGKYDHSHAQHVATCYVFVSHCRRKLRGIPGLPAWSPRYFKTTIERWGCSVELLVLLLLSSWCSDVGTTH